jgi:lipopolysaccharide/colanic/teichoic acid biosynthesis glycosyltransferase
VNAKRLLDVTLVLATAPIYGSVLLGSAALIAMIDGRPIFFSQVRVGRGGARFQIYKLRTMTLEADAGARRPTRLGAVLRRHGFDELPQFWNVLRGDMSLVGPRPLSEADTERLLAAEASFAARYSVAPGITGLAQVSATPTARATAHADAEYASRTSLALDVAILVRTVWINVVGKPRGVERPKGST